MSCSKEEIERKRLAALQKRQNLLANRNTPIKTNPAQSVQGGSPLPSSSNSGYKSFTSYSNRNHPYAKPNVSGGIQEKNVPVGKVVSGTVYLISEDRFEVNPSEFCAPLIDIFKSLPSKSYDSKSKLWNFSINDYQQLMSKVAPLAPHVVLGPIPPYVLRVLREEAMDPSCVDLTPIEVTLRHKLMPFQEEGVRFGISRRGRCMIADDMGLGKTFQALAIASYYRHNWPLLIVTTSSMRFTWQSKIQELLPSVPMMNVATLTSGKDTQLVADKQTEVVIVSYKITSMYTDLLKSKKFGIVIIDESHYLKSHKAQCTMALAGITRQCARAVLLSGTPALSRPAELYTQLSLIEPGFFTSYTEYGKRYCDGKQTNFGWDMTGQSNLTELQIILQKRFLIRRTKEQVLTKLEGKTRETVLLDQSLLDHSQETEKELSEVAEAYKTSRSSDKHAALITYFSESAKVKIPAVCCTRGDYLKVYWEVQGPGPPGAINERSAWARELCGSRADAPPALYSPGPSLVLEFHTGAKQNNATGFVGTYSFIDRRHALCRSSYITCVAWFDASVSGTLTVHRSRRGAHLGLKKNGA